MKTSKKTFNCTRCGRELKNGKWIVGKDRSLAEGKIPRYCWPGEGCMKVEVKSDA